MKINVKGKGVVSFPDSMSQEEILAVLRDKFKAKPDYAAESLQAVKAIIDKPTIIKEPVIVETQVIVKEPVEVERIIEKPVERIIEKQVIVEKHIKPKGWTFEIERDDDGIIGIRAIPDKG